MILQNHKKIIARPLLFAILFFFFSVGFQLLFGLAVSFTVNWKTLWSRNFFYAQLSYKIISLNYEAMHPIYSLIYFFLYCIDRNTFPVLHFLRILLFSEQAHCLWAGVGYEWCWVFYGFALALGGCFLAQRCGGKGKSAQRVLRDRQTKQMNRKAKEQTELSGDTFIVKAELRPGFNAAGSQTAAWECIVVCFLSSCPILKNIHTWMHL